MPTSLVKRAGYYLLLALSTLIFTAVVADWVYSIFWSETLILVRGRQVFAIDNFSGEIAFWRGEFKPGEWYWDGLHHEHWPGRSAKKTLEFSVEDPAGSEVAFAGFVITTQRHFPTTMNQTFHPSMVAGMKAIVLPSWFLTLLFGALPAMAAYRYIRGLRRRGEGMCKVCGYDLRATTDRCPECGTPVAAANVTRSPARPVS